MHEWLYTPYHGIIHLHNCIYDGHVNFVVQILHKDHFIANTYGYVFLARSLAYVPIFFRSGKKSYMEKINSSEPRPL